MKKFLLSIMTVLSLSGFLMVAAPAAVLAAPCPAGQSHINPADETSACVSGSKKAVCEGIGLTGGNCNGGETEINGVVTQVVNLLSVIVGVVAVIMVIIGGLKYITSSGDTNKVSSAKNTILYAIVGLIIVALAQFIVRFVLNRATA